MLQQASLDQGHGRLHTRLKYDFRTSDVVVHLIEGEERFNAVTDVHSVADV